jgi:hypothetical protein
VNPLEHLRVPGADAVDVPCGDLHRQRFVQAAKPARTRGARVF